jgi:hypothetical protein
MELVYLETIPSRASNELSMACSRGFKHFIKKLKLRKLKIQIISWIQRLSRGYTLLGPDAVGCPHDFPLMCFEQEVQLITVDLKTVCYSRKMNLSNGVNLIWKWTLFKKEVW